MILWEVFMDIGALRRQGLTERAIARKLKIHRNTVKKYLQQRQTPRYEKEKRKKSVLDGYYQIIDDFLKEDNYRATWIFERIRQLGYSGSYDMVKIYVRKVKQQRQRQAFIRFETIPGLQGQMDWADLQVTDVRGLNLVVYLFVLVLGFSRAMFAKFINRCSLQAFMDAHIEAFHYLGGIPMEVLYDNMKHVVISRDNGQAVFNVEFAHFAKHYGFKPLACPPYSPWVKGKVERPVDYIREAFWRGYRFTTLEQANQDLLKWLTETANRRVHGTHRQGVDMRWQQELASLSCCPASDYDTSIREYRKVYKDCSISYNASRYQVPMELIGKKVLLKIKDGIIRFFDDDRLMATHSQATEKGSWVTDAAVTAQILAQRQNTKATRRWPHKAMATRGLADASLYPQVLYRPLSVYDQIVSQGGGVWTN